MSEDQKKAASTGQYEMVVSQEQQAKITEVRELIGQLSDKESVYCSDASISRYLMSRNLNVKKAAQMLKQSLKWRKEFKPEEIRWEDVAADAESGSIYRPNYQDKYGRSVIVITPRRQNSKSLERQVKHFVHCLENAILNLPPHQEQLVWLVDLEGIKMSDISFKTSREIVHVFQSYYPKRLGLIILFNAPVIFQPFFKMMRLFLETEIYNKIKFCYSDDHNSKKILEDLFDMDKLESAFGGNGDTGFDINKYAERMKEHDNKFLSS
ncbi:random slug protein 5 [Vigna radiata var. radiata]|uniref:Random slug protein 5 n=1 Tax=Vigna radiata var. radiata TaxID=3916 RepID=A0A1S3U338_VIGRR|nr:random slug protein 5 [Vigna radiata var. radiata]